MTKKNDRFFSHSIITEHFSGYIILNYGIQDVNNIHKSCSFRINNLLLQTKINDRFF